MLIITSFKINSQIMEPKTIKLSSKLNLYEKVISDKDKTVWQLFLSKEGKETVELEKIIVENHPFINKDFLLYTPSLIDAFKESDYLYAFVYKERRLFFYDFEFTNNIKFNKKDQKITEVFIGSIENFGGYKFNIQKFNINNKNYFYLHYGRDVGGKNNILLSLNKSTNTINKLTFSESIKKIKDEDEMFKSLDLEKNIDNVGLEIKKVLIANKHLNNFDTFKYLGNIDITPFLSQGSRYTGTIYFLYQDNNVKPKIIRYNNDDNEWLIGDYKEEEIKQE